jgi:Flp pilus assembly protein TadB
VSPFYYFLLVWALLIGFVVWDEIPTPALLIGSAIVVASGLFLLWHEARRKAAAKREFRAMEEALRLSQRRISESFARQRR